ncbi:hypothetical protein HYPSUDRAFT_198786 [Hypholoma sublateritium FD-334 SS-4]|uniref:Uncharacterized protein n=1 Tax=Hypholoma sublateritium (strain FD-334 SS-4) TaxID=945553 RepID=A0A0D2LFT4_HYPSF|nr:hypothetical protein HYPSUDRAFT_198786 [Hypholoma sublateritium FD-334 SS-4]
MSPPTPSAGPPPPPQNNGSSIATSASLYLYTFLATLVLLLSVSAAIVIRSFILRRRHRLMVEEAIRNGTWVPPSPPSRPARVDLSKKPVLWEAYVDDKGGVTSWRSAGGEGMERDHWRAEHSKDWETIKPFSATYVSKPAETSPTISASHSTHSLPTNGLGSTPSTTSVRGRSAPGYDAQASGTVASPATISPSGSASPSAEEPPPRRTLFSRAMSVLNPTPPMTSPLPAPVTSGIGLAPDGQREVGHAMAELHQRSTTPSMMRVAVLIAMPTPPAAGANAPAGPHSHPLHSSAAPAPSDEDHPLPHLEVGVAEVLMVPAESSVPYARGKRDTRDSIASRESDTSEV